jgi:putative transposase
MLTGRPKAILTISSDERAYLMAITRSPSLPAALTLNFRGRTLVAKHKPSPNSLEVLPMGRLD